MHTAHRARSRYDSPMRFRTTLLALACLGLASNSAPQTRAMELYLTPYLQNVTPTSITVMWETTGVIVGTVEFGEHDRFDREATDSRPRTIHEVHLTGLDPATTYTYRVRFGDQVLSPASFTTAPPRAPRTGEWWSTATTGRIQTPTPATSSRS